MTAVEPEVRVSLARFSVKLEVQKTEPREFFSFVQGQVQEGDYLFRKGPR